MAYIVVSSTESGWNTQMVEAKNCSQALDKALEKIEKPCLPIMVRKIRTKHALKIVEHNKKGE